MPDKKAKLEKTDSPSVGSCDLLCDDGNEVIVRWFCYATCMAYRGIGKLQNDKLICRFLFFPNDEVVKIAEKRNGEWWIGNNKVELITQ